MSVDSYERPFDDIEGWREDQVFARHQARQIVDGETILRDLDEPKSAMAVLLAALREDAGKAVQDLMDADLFSDAGLVDARRAQARVNRFTELIALIAPLIEAARNADDLGELEPAVQQQMEKLNGKPARYIDP